MCKIYINISTNGFSPEVLGSDNLTQGILKSGKDPLQAQFSKHRERRLSSVAA